ncbi:unnamed protein product [[Candida] boidinii]|uniref:Unnamed protein product n=1 Tax=Candida boidinii TaxID=5477 RepID=A0A9W6T379_CANBO|nr:unnamed protein product [[Candida] boidinii]GME98588.1 unnamed protein product [[Candida] boidinii]GMF63476.1 unnamed protein product [[Candida] boidinii]GMF98454.1 unnamed protein product [[Candida] boidinii]
MQVVKWVGKKDCVRGKYENCEHLLSRVRRKNELAPTFVRAGAGAGRGPRGGSDFWPASLQPERGKSKSSWILMGNMTGTCAVTSGYGSGLPLRLICPHHGWAKCQAKDRTSGVHLRQSVHQSTRRTACSDLAN